MPSWLSQPYPFINCCIEVVYVELYFRVERMERIHFSACIFRNLAQCGNSGRTRRSAPTRAFVPVGVGRGLPRSRPFLATTRIAPTHMSLGRHALLIARFLGFFSAISALSAVNLSSLLSFPPCPAGRGMVNLCLCSPIQRPSKHTSRRNCGRQQWCNPD
jgi:hypothetical protein